MGPVNQALTLFLSLLVEATPFLLLGVAFSSGLAVLIDERALVKRLPKHPALAALTGSLFGCLFPVCECGNVPVARRLLMQGAPSAMAIGFLLAAPTVNPIVFWATWVAFRDQPAMVFWRVGLDYSDLSDHGLVFSVQKDMRPFLQPAIARAIFPIPPKPEPASGGYRQFFAQRRRLFVAGVHGQALKLDQPMMARYGATTAVLQQSWRDKARAVLEMMLQEFRELGAVLVFGQRDRGNCASGHSPRLDLGPGTRTDYLHRGDDGAGLGGVHLLDGRLLLCPLLCLSVYQRLLAGLSGVWPHDRPQEHFAAADHF
jgi:uncharacterized membrane protein YraQ (UPF0718 family)